MWDYITVGICFLVLIAIKFYLFRVSYVKKMKYFSDPEEMAVEFYSNMQKQNSEAQIKQTIENIHLLAKRNITVVKDEFEKGLNDQTLEVISERLRNTTIIIALIKHKYKQNENIMKTKLKQIGQTIYQDFTILTKLSEWCNEVESCKKNKVKSKHSKTDIHLVATIKAYVEYVNKEIGEYFKPY